LKFGDKSLFSIAVIGGTGKSGKYLVGQLLSCGQAFKLHLRDVRNFHENRGRMATSLEDCPGDKISSTDLADFLIAQLVEKEFWRKSPFIANI
jgi:hypothetical protein